MNKVNDDLKLITGLTFCSDERGITCQGHPLLEQLSIFPIGEDMLLIGECHGPMFYQVNSTS